MQKRFSILTLVIVVLAAMVITFQATWLIASDKWNGEMNELLAANPYLAKLSEIDGVVRELYIRDIDEDALADGIMSGYIAGLGDKYSVYLNAEDFKELVSDQNAELVGVGVNVIYDSIAMAIDIVSVLPESPALEAGVLPGDLVVSVGGTAVSELGYYGAIDQMRGEEGTYAEFTVLRDGAQLDFRIKRAKITEITVMPRMAEDKDGNKTNVGVIRITGFDKLTPEQLEAAVTELRADGAEKLVFDVRSNPGGELNSIISILDYLLPEGPIVRIVESDGSEDVRSSDAECLGMPYAVLVDSSTASAAELFSSALQDYAKKGSVDATLIGVTTYGKGTMQTIMPLSDGSAVSVSCNLYNPPFSDNYEGIGVVPDITEELSEEASKINIYRLTDAQDNQLQRALEILADK